ncbi:MAG TPA: hypothetical protein VF315_03325, partial [Steroidobacteraceae bacterium]
MIQHRMMQLDSSGVRAIETLSRLKSMEAVTQAVLELLGQAAGSECATYWVIDAKRQRLRPIATWDASRLQAPARAMF